MCGICGFSAVRSLSTGERERALGMLSVAWIKTEERGRDAAGAFVVGRDGISTVKQPGPSRNLVDRLVRLTLEVGGRRPMVVAHCRKATSGSPLLNENNHPFQAGRIVGVHNGVFYQHHEFAPFFDLEGECDSEVLFQLLHALKEQFGYERILQDVNAYNRVVFFDRDEKALYAFSGNSRGLAVARDEETGVVWFGTEPSYFPTDSAVTWRWLKKRQLYRLGTRPGFGLPRKG